MADKKKSGGVKAMATWEKSTKRMERYKIGDNSAGVSGTLYVPKDGSLPKSLSVTFQKEDD
jgi:hypothetical protein